MCIYMKTPLGTFKESREFVLYWTTGQIKHCSWLHKKDKIVTCIHDPSLQYIQKDLGGDKPSIHWRRDKQNGQTGI